ncbi:hypothetical protein [Actinacidiphila glaucinigra]|uniref:hypothetical protein n=1 Tax=Actinacidiphila glaucinigra TaxID=235986 RepID=UPI00371B2185
MVSERRRAKMGAVEAATEGIPDWIWHFHLNRWVSARKAAGEPIDLGVFCRERDEWHVARSAWLAQHGMTEDDLWRLRREE